MKVIFSLNSYRRASAKQNIPDSGINIWIELPEDLNADSFPTEYCHPNDITYLTDRLCYPNEPMYNFCRLCYTALEPNDIDKAIKLFCRLLVDYYQDAHEKSTV